MDKVIQLFLFVFFIFIAGCTTTKAVKVPVPVSCPKPAIPEPAKDYLDGLTEASTPSDFVKACLATRESYRTSNEDCLLRLKAYE